MKKINIAFVLTTLAFLTIIMVDFSMLQSTEKITDVFNLQETHLIKTISNDYIEDFSNSTYKNDDNIISFEGVIDSKKISLSETIKLNSNLNNRLVSKEIEASYDLDLNVYRVKIVSKDEIGNELEVFEGEFEPIFAQNENGITEIYIEFEEKLIPLSIFYSKNTSDLIPTGTIFNDDNAFSDITSTSGGGMLLLAVVILPYVIDTSIEVLNETTSILTEIFEWFKTVVTSTVNDNYVSEVISTSYRVNLESVDYDFYVLTRSKVSSVPLEEIFIAIADPTTGLMWISYLSITEELGTSILFSENLISSLDGSRDNLCVSTYAPNSITAHRLAINAGGGAVAFGPEVHGRGSAGYYYHYHPRINGYKGVAHSFYGYPTM